MAAPGAGPVAAVGDKACTAAVADDRRRRGSAEDHIPTAEDGPGGVLERRRQVSDLGQRSGGDVEGEGSRRREPSGGGSPEDDQPAAAGDRVGDDDGPADRRPQSPGGQSGHHPGRATDRPA